MSEPELDLEQLRELIKLKIVLDLAQVRVMGAADVIAQPAANTTILYQHE